LIYQFCAFSDLQAITEPPFCPSGDLYWGREIYAEERGEEKTWGIERTAYKSVAYFKKLTHC